MAVDLDALAALAREPLADHWLEALAAGEPYRRFLHWLVLKAAPEAALEIGVDGAQTSALMAAACASVGALCVGVDHRLPPPLVAEVQRRYGYRYLCCDSLGAAEVVRGLLGGRRLGVVFQDSSHHAEPSRLEWEYYKTMLAPAYHWVCDDVTPAFRLPDEPRGMLEYFEALPGRKQTFPGLHVGNVLGVVKP